MILRIPYPSEHGTPIHQKTEDNITSINNNKKEEEGKLKNLENNDIKKIINFYEDNITLITNFVAQDMQKYLDDGLSAELIIEAMKEAVSRNKRNWKYVASILNNCCNNNIKTAKQFQIQQEEFKSNKNQSTNKKHESEDKIEYEELQFEDEEDYRKKLFKKQKG